MSARVQEAPFDLATELQGFGPDAGAIVTFQGLVRSEDGRLTALELEHYPGMTEKALTRFGQDAALRFALSDWRIIHRYGRLSVGQPIMMVACAARHRAAAFDGAAFLMDWLKSRAPFWKREITAEGPGDWVAAKDADEAALDRWSHRKVAISGLAPHIDPD